MPPTAFRDLQTLNEHLRRLADGAALQLDGARQRAHSAVARAETMHAQAREADSSAKKLIGRSRAGRARGGLVVSDDRRAQ